MKILFDGASSYIGLWIIKDIVEAGHEVVATFRRNEQEYDGLRLERVNKVKELCKTEFGVTFGDEKFIEIIKSSNWDLFCHHAADVTNANSPDFDWLGAVKSNTNNLSAVIDELKNHKCNHIILTGSLYEADEGNSGKPVDACNLYGLSKTVTWGVFRYMCFAKNVYLGKFVIPISFGPMEDPKFHSYLVKSWLNGETPSVRTPKYTRDDIPVTLLSKSYLEFAKEFIAKSENMRIDPSYYVYVRDKFTKKFASEMEPRLGVPCPVEFADQKEFPEPIIKANSTKLDTKKLGWDEKTFWDELAKFYLDHYSNKDGK